MMTIKVNDFSPLVRKLAFVAGFLFFVAILLFSFFYLCSSYPYLIKWFFGLNDCFYHNTQWSTIFFTPLVESAGNKYCVLAIAIASCGLFYLTKSIISGQTNNKKTFVYANPYDLVAIVLCVSSALFQWSCGNKLAMPCYDEVFTAQNAAGINPFQTVSYYMLPNNHLLFNLVNGILFHSFVDKVASGRIISLVAYCLFTSTMFIWFKNMVQNRLLAILISITLSLQFPVWGFSFQARGYELYLLAEWGMAISLFYYLLYPAKKWLYLNLLCIVIGYFCLPSFLYFHVAQCAFMLLYPFFFKQKTILFWKYQVLALSLTFCCYLPTLCFSGLDAVIQNNYVVPMTGFKTIPEFTRWMFPYFEHYVSHIFSDLRWGNLTFNLILFFTPVVLLFDKKNKLNKVFGMFYITSWIVFIIIAIAMKRIPFERNLIGHYSLTLCGIILTTYWVIGLLLKNIKAETIKHFFLAVILIACSVHFIITNTRYLKDTLYEYDVNYYYNAVANGLAYIPSGSVVSISDEGFYAGYICMKHGCKLVKCPSGSEAYFVKRKSEPLLPEIAQKYTLLRIAYNNDVYDYEIYKKK